GMLVSMPLAQEMVLEDAVHCMHVVEYLQQHDLFEIRETVEMFRDDPVQAAVGPLLVVNEFRAVARCHDVTSFRLSMDIMRAIAHISNSHLERRTWRTGRSQVPGSMRRKRDHARRWTRSSKRLLAF